MACVQVDLAMWPMLLGYRTQACGLQPPTSCCYLKTPTDRYRLAIRGLVLVLVERQRIRRELVWLVVVQEVSLNQPSRKTAGGMHGMGFMHSNGAGNAHAPCHALCLAYLDLPTAESPSRITLIALEAVNYSRERGQGGMCCKRNERGGNTHCGYFRHDLVQGMCKPDAPKLALSQ